MFIMNTRSIIAVMSKFASACTVRGTASGFSGSSRLGEFEAEVMCSSGQSVAGAEVFEHLRQAGGQRLLKQPQPNRHAGQKVSQRDGGPQSHRRADQGDTNFVGDL